jgi:hypothetical protein
MESDHSDDEAYEGVLEEKYDKVSKAYSLVKKRLAEEQIERKRLADELATFKIGQIHAAEGELDFLVEFVTEWKKNWRVCFDPTMFLNEDSYPVLKELVFDLAINFNSMSSTTYPFAKAREIVIVIREFLRYKQKTSEVIKLIEKNDDDLSVTKSFVFQRNPEFKFHKKIQPDKVTRLKLLIQQILEFKPSEKVLSMPIYKTITFLKRYFNSFDVDFFLESAYFDVQINLPKNGVVRLDPKIDFKSIEEGYVKWARTSDEVKGLKLIWGDYFKWMKQMYLIELITATCYYQDIQLLEKEVGIPISKETKRAQSPSSSAPNIKLTFDKSIQTEEESLDYKALYMDLVDESENQIAQIAQLTQELGKIQNELQVSTRVNQELEKKINEAPRPVTASTRKIIEDYEKCKEENLLLKRDKSILEENTRGLSIRIRDLEKEIENMSQNHLNKITALNEDIKKLSSVIKDNDIKLNETYTQLRLLRTRSDIEGPEFNIFKEWAKSIPIPEIDSDIAFANDSEKTKYIVELMIEQEAERRLEVPKKLFGDKEIYYRSIIDENDQQITGLKDTILAKNVEIDGLKEALHYKDPLVHFQNTLLKNSSDALDKIFKEWYQRTERVTGWFGRIEESIQAIEKKGLPIKIHNESLGKKVHVAQEFIKNPSLLDKITQPKGTIFNPDSYKLFQDIDEKDLTYNEWLKRCQVKDFISDIKPMGYDSRMCQGEWAKQKNVNTYLLAGLAIAKKVLK